MNGAGENVPATVLGISRLLFAQPAAPAPTCCRLSWQYRPGQLIFRDQITTHLATTSPRQWPESTLPGLIAKGTGRPGQYLLSGSARVLALRRLPDTLPGRVETIELWPLSQGNRWHPDRSSTSSSIRARPWFTNQLSAGRSTPSESCGVGSPSQLTWSRLRVELFPQPFRHLSVSTNCRRSHRDRTLVRVPWNCQNTDSRCSAREQSRSDCSEVMVW